MLKSVREKTMAKDIIEIVNEYIAEDNPKKWAKLSSTVESRRLELLLLKEILLEIRSLNRAKTK
jgi:hypothetical protein